ncbi:flavodoxin [Sporomusa malonica]|uniref:Flavodoxin n=1 Tax=Sporomusa malonica TaxID=112901 RepID=A0A1W1ZAX5_9FIRM|nr:flavodoxin [Sporomusa malonica]SMC45564.1 Flavodoxin [Sporomusa malonica]
MKIKYIVQAFAVLAAIAFATVGILQKPDAVSETSKAPQQTAAVSSQKGEKTPSIQKKKALVVYFSYTGNTRILAEQIRQNVGGDIFELQPATPYSTDYATVEKQGKQEVESGYKPPLKAKVENLASYDVIFVGTPIWWYTIAPPVATFLAESDLAGKTIIPFCTHGGYGAGHNLEDIKKLAPKAQVLDELVLRGNSKYEQKDIFAWLSKVGFGE